MGHQQRGSRALGHNEEIIIRNQGEIRHLGIAHRNALDIAPGIHIVRGIHIQIDGLRCQHGNCNQQPAGEGQ